MIIRAGEHIYGNVERDVSPTRIGGFQTLAHSKGVITNEESVEIEKRLVHQSSGAEPTDLLFFSLTSGKSVVSRVVPLPDVDRFGRRGIYLAHSFIFSGDDFVKLNCNPFIALKLLEPRFVSSTAQALSMIEPEGSNIGSVRLDVTEEAVQAIELEMLSRTQGWDSEQLNRLAYLAVNSAQLRTERQSVAVVGTPESIESTLGAAFSLLPSQLRLNCSFDTYSYGRNPVANYFWALGYPPSSSVRPGFISVDATRKAVQMHTPPAGSPYERWLYASVIEHRLPEIMKHRDAAWELHNFLLGEPYDQTSFTGTSIDFLRSFTQANCSHLAAVVERTLRKALGASLVARLQNHILAHCRQLDPLVLVQTLQDGFALEFLAEELHNTLRGEKPSQDEIVELRELLKRTSHDLLALRILAWARNIDGLRKQLEVLSEEKCREAAQILMMEDRVPVTDLLADLAAKAIVRAFAELAGSHPELREQIPHMVRRLISLRQETLLPELMPFLAELKPKQLKEIKAIVREQSNNVPDSFIQSLEEALASAGADEKTRVSLLSSLKKGLERRFGGE